MNSRTITKIGIIAAILITVSGAELAFARGGGGSYNGYGTGTNAGIGTTQIGDTNPYQYQYGHQNQHQYRHNKDASAIRSGNGKLQGDQTLTRSRTQLRGHSSREIEKSE